MEAAVSLIWMREEPNARRPAHTRAEIAAAALEIADPAEGFEAVSMRRVAQKLGAGTMTLYHYVANKDELITLMFDAVMGEVLVAEEELEADWRRAMTEIATNSLRAFQRHRWAFDHFGDGRPGPNGLRHFEQSLRAVDGLDISAAEKFELIGQVDDYVFGFALRDASEREEHEQGWPPGVRRVLPARTRQRRVPADPPVPRWRRRGGDRPRRRGPLPRGPVRARPGASARRDQDRPRRRPRQLGPAARRGVAAPGGLQPLDLVEHDLAQPHRLGRHFDALVLAQELE